MVGSKARARVAEGFGTHRLDLIHGCCVSRAIKTCEGFFGAVIEDAVLFDVSGGMRCEGSGEAWSRG